MSRLSIHNLHSFPFQVRLVKRIPALCSHRLLNADPIATRHSKFAPVLLTRARDFHSRGSIWIRSSNRSCLPTKTRPFVLQACRADNADQQSEQNEISEVSNLQKNKSELIFLGTGTSEGIPRVSCLTDPWKKCRVCHEAVKPGNKNRRLNTSILIRHSTSSGTTNILVDAGKFFYHSAVQWFPHYGLRCLDAVIVTHSHADAIGGFDDLRDWTNNIQKVVPIYLTQRDLEVMQKTHYYLTDTTGLTPGTAVSKLNFNIISEEPFYIHGIKVIPLPVWHGIGYRSLGFRFGNVCYISDVSAIADETYNLLNDCELLILDALRPDRSSATHFGLPAALEEVRKIQPKKTLFTGMMHLMHHEEINDKLCKLMESEHLDVQLSYDGLCIPINF